MSNGTLKMEMKEGRIVSVYDAQAEYVVSACSWAKLTGQQGDHSGGPERRSRHHGRPS